MSSSVSALLNGFAQRTLRWRWRHAIQIGVWIWPLSIALLAIMPIVVLPYYFSTTFLLRAIMVTHRSSQQLPFVLHRQTLPPWCVTLLFVYCGRLYSVSREVYMIGFNSLIGPGVSAVLVSFRYIMLDGPSATVQLELETQLVSLASALVTLIVAIDFAERHRIIGPLLLLGSNSLLDGTGYLSDFLNILDHYWLQLLRYYNRWHISRYRREQPELQQVFKYMTLKEGEIRLLELLPHGMSIAAPLAATIEHRLLSDQPDYEAISYCWGSTELTDRIVIGVYYLPITESAMRTLRARQRLDSVRYVWIDAICINQGDSDEKTAQVKLMAAIYSQASRVIAFPSHDPAVRIIEPLIREESAAAVERGIGELWEQRSYAQRRTRWHAMHDLMGAAYFSRSWIFQELAVAQRIEVYMYGKYVTWHTFSTSMMRWNDRWKTSSQVDGMIKFFEAEDTLVPTDPVLNPCRVVQAIWEDVSTLDALLEHNLPAKATDPRDKILAMLSVARDIFADDQLLQPDYSKTVREVYINVAKYLFVMRQTPSLVLLARAGIDHCEWLPSWVPNFTGLEETSPLLQYARERQYSACGSYIDVRSGLSPGSLHLEGLICDEIEKIVEYDMIATQALLLSSIVPPYSSVQFMLFARMMIQADQIAELYKILVAGYLGCEPISSMWSNVVASWSARLYQYMSAQYPEAKQELKILRMQLLEYSVDPVLEAVMSADDCMTWFAAMVDSCRGCRFAVTKEGRACLVPRRARAGDYLFIPYGSRVPFIVRGSSRFQLVGDAYVHGIMHGEAMQASHSKCEILLS